MPRLDTLDQQMEEMKVPGPGTFKFSAVKPEELGASEYTLVTLCIDKSGSVRDFKDSLKECISSIIKACQKSERAENLMVRLITFSTNIVEVHGFKELHTIDPTQYEDLDPYGGTALYDSAYSGIGASIAYAESLIQQGFNVNGAVYIVTDGDDNSSTMNAHNVKEIMDDALRGEKIESLIAVLVGVKDPNITGQQWATHMTKRLETFQKEAGLTQYVDVGDATPQKLAKLAEFVSQSVSSQSNSLNSGSPSQQINVTF